MDKRSKENGEGAPFRVVFFVVPGFSLMALSSAVEPLRSANRHFGEKRYEWVVMSLEAGPVAAGNRLEIASAHGIADMPEADLTVFVASLDIDDFREHAVLERIRRLHAERRLVGAVSNGTLLLARAGILGGRRVTIHWEMQRRLVEEFPDIEVRPDLYCRDGTIMTAAGGIASMDMILSLIADREGHEAAAAIADQFLHGPVRGSTEVQRQDVSWRYQVTDRRMVSAIRLMEEHQDDPLKIAQIAGVAGVSERQLARLFENAFGQSPLEFYTDLRLQTARKWLLQSTESLERIAELTGFSSLGHFSRSFKTWCGEPPSAVRRKHRMQIVGKLQEIGEVP